MSEQLHTRTQEKEFTDEAVAYADLAVEILANQLEVELPPSGLWANDRAEAFLRNSDREMQQEVDTYGLIYFGHTRQFSQYFYHALLSGYNPTQNQIKQCEANGGHNFLWDEIMELYTEHPEIYKQMQRYGHGAKNQPVDMPYHGAYAVPKDKLRDIWPLFI